MSYSLNDKIEACYTATASLAILGIPPAAKIFEDLMYLRNDLCKISEDYNRIQEEIKSKDWGIK